MLKVEQVNRAKHVYALDLEAPDLMDEIAPDERSGIDEGLSRDL